MQLQKSIAGILVFVATFAACSSSSAPEVESGADSAEPSVVSDQGNSSSTALATEGSTTEVVDEPPVATEPQVAEASSSISTYTCALLEPAVDGVIDRASFGQRELPENEALISQNFTGGCIYENAGPYILYIETFRRDAGPTLVWQLYGPDDEPSAIELDTAGYQAWLVPRELERSAYVIALVGDVEILVLDASNLQEGAPWTPDDLQEVADRIADLR